MTALKTTLIDVLNNIRKCDEKKVSSDTDYLFSNIDNFYYFMKIYKSLYVNNLVPLHSYLKLDPQLLIKFSYFFRDSSFSTKIDWLINFKVSFFSDKELNEIFDINVDIYDSSLAEFWKSVEDESIFNHSDEVSAQLDRIIAKNPNIADGI